MGAGAEALMARPKTGIASGSQALSRSTDHRFVHDTGNWRLHPV